MMRQTRQLLSYIAVYCSSYFLVSWSVRRLRPIPYFIVTLKRAASGRCKYSIRASLSDVFTIVCNI